MSQKNKHTILKCNSEAKGCINWCDVHLNCTKKARTLTSSTCSMKWFCAKFGGLSFTFSTRTSTDSLTLKGNKITIVCAQQCVLNLDIREIVWPVSCHLSFFLISCDVACLPAVLTDLEPAFLHCTHTTRVALDRD